ncbi:DNA polymerase epsilon catalytic subunit A Pol2 [Schizosaccharomyces japonicus yFS275]|uniref:DNA polymerase epsilon catalytic subunit n=1 Tax=Schizosaccharomyces japonicus (strain yFS275 / FY16936) TaxID=402676 RepID=B6K1H9_SCHJY|nr:DNA polymerase epsilon catalytic subunit A Pol2 [Schizosaccharomyces japonicus yFS275]EEB07800.2 DNA polymerase epsilon catalytic subunit A Pol2 [Schizosaccharomyces japonicus yFS275]
MAPNFSGKQRSFRPAGSQSRNWNSAVTAKANEEVVLENIWNEIQSKNEIDTKMGFDNIEAGPPRIGWLLNVHPTSVPSDDNANGKSAIALYFIQEDGETFRVTVPYRPYLYVSTKEGKEAEVEDYLKKAFPNLIKDCKHVYKDDLKLVNHLVGYQKLFVQLFFDNQMDLFTVRRLVLSASRTNENRREATNTYADIFETKDNKDESTNADAPLDYILDVREYDVPYHSRSLIDLNVRVGQWFNVSFKHGEPSITLDESRIERAEPVIMAFDIETTKSPLKFPDSTFDQVMMISYMIDGQGFLITNREIISEDIQDFEYTPKPEFEGPFVIFNEENEMALLQRFFRHIRSAKPSIIVTYNGDFFDWPFVDARASCHGMDMFQEIGFSKDQEDEYKSTYCAHMDAFRWVKRDSYLPQGSQGLKAVTVAKLGYDPIELDPELMTIYASEKPQVLAQYSVSDAVATYYLYMKYVHPFIFSLCNIIPLNPDEVLRKGTGTLCETLLTVQACTRNIVLPNKHVDPLEKFFDGHLLASETYVGGHVESLESGVFRADIPTDFHLDPNVYQELLDQLDSALHFSITIENKKNMEDISNYDETLRDSPTRKENPRIYHLDVASMYPNIMITNRLQPDSIKDESFCASCDLNVPGKTCDRKMIWAWRGEYYPPKRNEYNMIRNALQSEVFPPKFKNGPPRSFDDLSPPEQAERIQKRLSDYSKKVYHKLYDNTIINKETVICQKENSFYIDTVKSFRDRRYDFKGLQKKWGKILAERQKGGTLSGIEEAKKMIVLYNSLQLAHKVILNSFYGYVMRKGSRWYSIEMAGITCLTGATIIQMARQIVERAGRPLELDTDGIWCILPESFPENFTLKTKTGGKFTVSYPCVMLNHLVHEKFTNHQFSVLKNAETLEYETFSENSIFFEVDGPYRAMVLPASKEEGKNLKKRYAVFNFDGSLAELKGFEIKRRGELKLIKTFQAQIFKVFLQGKTLEECYAEVAKVADNWLEVLFSKGSSVDDDELFDLISENRSMTKTLKEYGNQKSTSITTARRWLKDFGRDSFDIRSILDWDYYLERLGSVVQKLISIPAVLQRIANPVPRIPLPNWLFKRVAEQNSKFQQVKLESFLSKQKVEDKNKPVINDIEDILSPAKAHVSPIAIVKKRKAVHSATEAPLTFKETFVPINEDYRHWLVYAKKKWAFQKQVRDRRRTIIGHSNSISGAFQSSMEELINNTWHILQIRPTDVPGLLLAWIVVNKRLTSVKLKVHRKFYVNFKTNDLPEVEIEGCVIEKSNCILPHGKPTNNLFSLIIPEKIYQSECDCLSLIFSHNSVEVCTKEEYHLSNVPSLNWATCRLNGTVSGAFGEALETGFLTSMLNQSEDDYLADIDVKYVYLFHASFDNKMMVGLFYPHLSSADIIIVDKHTTDHSFPPLKKLYEEALPSYKQSEAPSCIKYGDTIEAGVSFCNSPKQMYKSLTDKLSKFVSSKLGVCTLILETSEAFILKKNLKILDDIPFAVIERHDTANMSFSWKSTYAKMMIRHYLGIGPWITHQRQLAAYASIPFCNFEKDNMQYLLDIEYARRLTEKQIILWWNKNPLPDLGGLEHDDILHLTSPSDNFELNYSGAYANASVDIHISNLAMCSILNSAIVNDAEGVEDFSALDDSYLASDSGNLEARFGASENFGLTYSLPILKDLVKELWLEAGKGDLIADLIIQHLVRWVQQTDAHMYDPVLVTHVRLLMRKTFLQLLAEFRRFGVHVVYANAKRVLISTKKPAIQTAASFANYVLKTIKSLPLFHFVDFTIREYWDYLLWMDPFNYGGKACIPESLAQTNCVLQTTVSWHIKKHLPSSMQNEFQNWIIEFVEEIHKLKMEKNEEQKLRVRVRNNNEDVEEEILGAGLIKRKFLAPLERQISQFQHQYQKSLLNSDVDVDFSIPQLPGTHLSPKNPVLEFAKSICTVFNLAGNLSLEVRALQKSLYSILNVRDFSKDTEFIYPSKRLQLEQVPCKHCGNSQDFDLCLNEELWPERTESGQLQFSTGWHCTICNLEYDRWAFEEMLVEVLQKQLLKFQVQDFHCAKCGNIRTSPFKSLCSCSGAWKMSYPQEKFLDLLSVYRNIAEYYEFTMLKAMVSTIDQSIS